ncbi:MAG: 50S ribosomal protein L13 [Armatimonadota bacterium]|nr:50S ribosomal protein L13 [Armatimonadota bacterium]
MEDRTLSVNPADVERNWYIVSARGRVLGHLAAEVATVLRGKHKPSFTPHVDCGDYVIVTDAERVQLTGNKRETKVRRWHTGYPGHLRSKTYDELLESEPEEVIRRTVRGMLPKSRLGRKMLRKLKVYAGSEHPHSAQQPQPLPER